MLYKEKNCNVMINTSFCRSIAQMRYRQSIYFRRMEFDRSQLQLCTNDQYLHPGRLLLITHFWSLLGCDMIITSSAIATVSRYLLFACLPCTHSIKSSMLHQREIREGWMALATQDQQNQKKKQRNAALQMCKYVTEKKKKKRDSIMLGL